MSNIITRISGCIPNTKTIVTLCIFTTNLTTNTVPDTNHVAASNGYPQISYLQGLHNGFLESQTDGSVIRCLLKNGCHDDCHRRHVPNVVVLRLSGNLFKPGLPEAIGTTCCQRQWNFIISEYSPFLLGL